MPTAYGTDTVLRLAVALGIGLLLGAERERRMGQAGRRGSAGLRTFALVALLGGVTQQVGGELLTAAVAFVIGATALAAYWKSDAPSTGITSEAALMVAFLLGVLAQHSPGLASALGVTVTILLATRTTLHRFVSTVLTDQEVHDALMLAASAIVLLPLIPNRAIDPFGVLNPFAVWRLAVLLMAISACGYVANRALGPRFGLPLSGLAGGFVSSAATVGSMGALAKERPELARPALAGALLSSVATPIELLALVAVASPRSVVSLLVPLALAGLATAICGALAMWQSPASIPPEQHPGRAFNPRVAILIAGLITTVTLLSVAVSIVAGNGGVSLAAAIGGFADAHAAAIGVASLVEGDRLAPSQAALPVLVAFSTNAATKVVMAYGTSTGRFGPAVLGSLVLAVASAWAGFALTR
ncbi:MAG: DUF4010 domain-containing protein [Dehalococcoidia bacterium]